MTRTCYIDGIWNQEDPEKWDYRIVAASVADIEAFISANGSAVLKSPLSGSGKILASKDIMKDFLALTR